MQTIEGDRVVLVQDDRILFYRLEHQEISEEQSLFRTSVFGPYNHYTPRGPGHNLVMTPSFYNDAFTMAAAHQLAKRAHC